jgi:sugar lactone lactonase YvrE
VTTARRVSDATAVLGESPLWDDAAGLRWLDITGKQLYTMDRSARIRRIALTRRVTAIQLGPGAGLLAVTTRGFGVLDPRTGVVAHHVTVPVDADATMNDAAIDAHGRCWAGSATHDGQRRSTLFRLVRRTASARVAGVGMSNGIDFSPDGTTMYHVDSTAGTVTAWAYDLATGRLGAARVLRTVPPAVGKPDGLTVDAGGHVWLAVWGAGQVWRLDPVHGRTVATVSVPTPLTSSCAFGGAGLATLYVTTARRPGDPASGALYAARAGAAGRRPHRFAGFAGSAA